MSIIYLETLVFVQPQVALKRFQRRREAAVDQVLADKIRHGIEPLLRAHGAPREPVLVCLDVGLVV